MINGNIRKILGIFLIIGVCLSLLGCTTENKDIQSNNVSNDKLIIEGSEENVPTIDPTDNITKRS